jgi:hypothetical protein
LIRNGSPGLGIESTITRERLAAARAAACGFQKLDVERFFRYHESRPSFAAAGCPEPLREAPAPA